MTTSIAPRDNTNTASRASYPELHILHEKQFASLSEIMIVLPRVIGHSDASSQRNMTEAQGNYVGQLDCEINKLSESHLVGLYRDSSEHRSSFLLEYRLTIESARFKVEQSKMPLKRHLRQLEAIHEDINALKREIGAHLQSSSSGTEWRRGTPTVLGKRLLH